MSELETTEVALATTEICEGILSGAPLECQEDAEEGAVNIAALGEGCQWALGDWIIKSCDKLVRDAKSVRGDERLALPSKPVQMRTIIGGICGRIGVSKRAAYYYKEVAAHWPVWETRAIGTLKHTAFIRAWELTDDPDFWIDMAKAAVPPWTPTQLVEEIRAAMGEEEIGSPITLNCLVDKIPFEDGERLILQPLDHEMIPFNPEGLAFKVRFTKLNPEKVNRRRA